jgi:hypothetical protein
VSVVAAGVLAPVSSPLRAADFSPPPLPTDAKAWIGEPQSWDALRGKVVLLDVWTFG